MSEGTSGRWTGYLLLAAGMSVVGTYVALAKPLTAAFPVFLLAWLRFAIASVVMIPWAIRRPGDVALDSRSRRALFVQSFFGNFLFSICMLIGVSLTSATASGVILSSLPAAVAALSWLFLRERVGWRVAVAVALAVAGLGILTLGRAGGPGATTSALGNLLIAGSVLCEAVYVILGKQLTATLSPRRISALINLIGLALMTPLGLWQAHDFAFGSVSVGVWGLLVFYALSASVFSTWLWLSGLRHVPASHSGVFTIAMPIAASVVGVSFLGEHFGLAHLLAFGCAAVGITLVTWPGRRAGAIPD
jgi:drug/metabolite transporter (DMT)-like permease